MSAEKAPQPVAERCPSCGAGLPPGDVGQCPYCGTRLFRPSPASMAPAGASWPPAPPARFYGYEYKSAATLFGLPLVHIAQGIDPQTGRSRVARGIIAVGSVAFGVIALGGVAVGGMAVGVLALGGMAAGLAAFGGISLALWLALGGLAISAQYAVGGLALAPHALGGNAQDPALLRWLERSLGPGKIG